MNKYEEALECPNCVLGLNCKTCKKKMVLQEAVEKAKAFDLIKEKEVNVSHEISNFETYYKYYEHMHDCNYTVEYILTEKEWNFLKEMLESK